MESEFVITTPRISADQAQVLDSNLLTSGLSCVLQMPTGSGKTWLASHAVSDALRRGSRAIYLTPLRALAEEVVADWCQRYKSPVGIFTGDYGVAGKPFPVAFQHARLLVMTPERLDACTRAWRSHWAWIPEIDVVVVDEFHLLGDRHRGARLEGAISRFRRLNPFTRIIGLSATLGNRAELADWLDGIEYGSSERPVPLRWTVVRYRQATDKPRLLIETVTETVSDGSQCLVFVQSRRRAEELGAMLAAHNIRAGHHHAGLIHDDRRNVEAAFRNDELDVLVATSTLEMGLNLPARQVILYDLQAFDGAGFRPLSTNTVWQRAGRAGRPGLDPEGEVVLFAHSSDRDASRFPLGHFEPIRSGLCEPNRLAEQILVEVSSGLARTSTQLQAVFRQSLAARQEQLPSIERAIDVMIDAGMLRCDQDDPHRQPQLRVTSLGRVAVRQMLSPSTVLMIRRSLDQFDDVTFLDLLIIAASCVDCEPVLAVDFEELPQLGEMLGKEPTVMLHTPAQTMVDALAVQPKRLLASLKMALVARSWTRLGELQPVADLHACYPFEVARLRESLHRVLTAMSAIVSANPEEPANEAFRDEDAFPSRVERIQALTQMIAAGLDETAVTLTFVEGIGPTIAKRLRDAGITDIEDLALASIQDIATVRGISTRRAVQWTNAAFRIVKSRSALRFREEARRATWRVGEGSLDVDPYRLRRALDLNVEAIGRRFKVSGGLEPHIVEFSGELPNCDCNDAANGYICKHVLAVRLFRGDHALLQAVRSLNIQSDDQAIDLYSLWFGAGHSHMRGERIMA